MEFVLPQALEALFPAQPSLCTSLQTYVQLLMRWNKTYNLTGFQSEQEIFEGFILQSRLISPYLEGHFFVDLGTGAGVPGLILSILHPERSFLLIDSNGKKIRFLTHAIQTLKLPNVRALQVRIEDFKTDTPIDGLLTKAFAPLDRTLSLCQHLPIIKFYALKGPQGLEEAHALQETQKRPCKIIPLPKITHPMSYLILVSGHPLP